MDNAVNTAIQPESDYAKPYLLAGFEVALIVVVIGLLGVSAGVYCLGFLPDFMG